MSSVKTTYLATGVYEFKVAYFTYYVYFAEYWGGNYYDDGNRSLKPRWRPWLYILYEIQ